MFRPDRRPSVRRLRSRGGSLRRFAHDISGGSALEFALVAFPLFLLLLAILEVGIVYFANFSLEHAVAQGARLVRTGQVHTPGFNANKFKTAVCKNIYSPLTCANLKLDVRSYSSFGGSGGAGQNLTSPLDSNGNMKSNFSFSPGVGGDIVVVRGFYELDFVGLLPVQIRLDNMNGGNRVLMATEAFRNEPFN